MIPWLIIIFLFASLCSAAMGMAWIVGVRNRWVLLIISTVAGLAAGVGLSLMGTAVSPTVSTSSAALQGSVYGAAIGSGVWLVLMVGTGMWLRGSRD